MSSEKAEFYHKRAIAETEMAYAATTEGAARLHAELALRYQALREQAKGRIRSEIPATVATEGECVSARGFHWSG